MPVPLPVRNQPPTTHSSDTRPEQCSECLSQQPVHESHAPHLMARTRNASALSVHMQQYLPIWASTPEPVAPGEAPWTAADEWRWRCLHPLCTGHEPVRWP